MCERGSSGLFYQLYESNEENLLRIQCSRMAMIWVTEIHNCEDSRARLPFLVSMTDDEIFMTIFLFAFCLIYLFLLLTFEAL